jgi:hypothetical protein
MNTEKDLGKEERALPSDIAKERAANMRKPTEAQLEAENRKRRRAIDDVRKRFTNGVKPGKFGGPDNPDAQLRAFLKVYGPVEAAMQMAARSVTNQMAQLPSTPEAQAEAQYMTDLMGQVIDIIMLQRHVDLERTGRSVDDMHAMSVQMTEEMQLAGVHLTDAEQAEAPTFAEVAQGVAEASGLPVEVVQEAIEGALARAAEEAGEGFEA